MIDMKLELVNVLDEIAKEFEENTEQLVDDTLKNIQQHVETAMELPKFGRVYGNHVASKPGEPPAIDTEDLIDSGKVEKHGRFEGTLTYDSDHAAAMEFGTVFVAPRPFLGPAAETERPNWNKGIERLVPRE